MAKRPQPYELWQRISRWPLGKWIYSLFVGFMAPYTGTICPRVLSFEPGRVRIRIRDRWRLRNPFRSVHAIALTNLGEAASGLALFSRLSPSQRAILVRIETEYLKKARGTLIGEGSCEADPQNGDVTVHADIKNAEGLSVAKVRALWRVDSEK